MSGVTIREKMDGSAGFTTGFDYLRIVLSLGVVVWHSVSYAGNIELAKYLWTGPFRFLGGIILPAFFALSGFLIAGSLLPIQDAIERLQPPMQQQETRVALSWHNPGRWDASNLIAWRPSLA
ncbi:acyltransferase family protein [Burkholderia multivorans]|uniref:acyltransferase family protein n=1 Tax=Burkholderia multivorans TaxID=87883 RepID=UPI0039C31C79